MKELTHFHNCPYCKKVHPCTDGCYSGRITNLICAECKARWKDELTDVKKHGTEWHNQPG